MFRLKCLGGLVLESSDELPKAALQRRRLLLLAILGRAVDWTTRDRLLLLLWPESTEESARHALDQLLYATRRDLGRDAIISEGGQLRLNPDLFTVDAAEFDAYLQRHDARAAVQLYGGPFLDGVQLRSVELERWVDGERAELQQSFLGALEQLGKAACEAGDHRAAVECFQRYVQSDPFSARGALGLMQAYAGAGDVAAAIRHAQTHRRLLREELGVDGNPEVVALETQLAATPPIVPQAVAAPPPGRASAPIAEAGVAVPPNPATRRSPRLWVVAASVVLLISLAGIALKARSAPPPVNTSEARVDKAAARDLYLRGRTAWNRRSREGLHESVVLFRRATELDPAYAEAFSGLADAYVILGYLGYMPGDAAFSKGKAAALRALALDPKLGQAYASLGVALQWERRWAEAERSFLNAIHHAPDYATGHHWYALLLRILGREREAVLHARRAAELDPLSIQISNTYGVTLYATEQLDSALRVYERIVVDEPDTAWVRQNPWVLTNFSKVASAAGRFEDAIRLSERALQAVPHHPRALYDLSLAYIAAGNVAAARAAFARADPEHPHHPFYRGMLEAELGNMDAAFVWLNRVMEWGPVLLLPLGSGEGAAKQLKADPRFEDLRRRLKLPSTS